MTSTAPYFVLASGGTGGHMMPAEAVADKLMEAGYEVTLITDTRGKSIGNVFQDMDSFVLNTSSHMAGGVAGSIKSFLSIISSTFTVRKKFKARRPSAVIGFGGYPSLPTVLAARSMGIPYVLHEQNAVLGRVNRLMAGGAKTIALSVEETERVANRSKTIVVGNPVRSLISKVANIAYAVPLGDGPIRLLIIGGSQGARILSDVVPEALSSIDPEYVERLVVMHQARAEDVDRVVQAYEKAKINAEVRPYFDDVAGILLTAQLIICRAGASTIAELTAMGRPAILVPLSIAADSHQLANARLIEAGGGGWVLEEQDFTARALSDLLLKLFDDMGKLREASEGMRSLAKLDAAEKLAAHVIELGDPEGNIPS